jgi:hypothetical protein
MPKAHNLCDYQCTTGKCLIHKFDFSGATVTSMGYRACVLTADNVVIDYAHVKVYVLDLNVQTTFMAWSQPTMDSVTFTNAAGTTGINSVNLATGDRAWFAHESTACSLPAAAGVTNTDAKFVVDGASTYSFNFQSITSFGFYKLCVMLAVDGTNAAAREYAAVELNVVAASIVEDHQAAGTYSSTYVRSNAAANFVFKSGSISMDTTGFLYSTPASQNPLSEYFVITNGLQRRFDLDKLHFVRQTETCSAGTKISLSGWSATPALTNLQTVTAAAIGAVQNASSSTLFRLCVERTFQKNTVYDPYPTGTFASTSTKWIDYPATTFMMSDLKVVQHFVTTMANTPVTLRGASALLPTDKVWFTSAVHASKPLTTDCNAIPTSAGATVTNAVTVSGLEANSEVTVHLDFASMTLPATAAGTPLGLCIARGTTFFSPGIRFRHGMTTLLQTSNPAAASLSCGSTDGCFAVNTGLGVVRQETRGVKIVNSAGTDLPWQGTNSSEETTIGFVEVTSACPEAPLTASNSAGFLRLVPGFAPPTYPSLVFSSTAVSNVLRRLCRTVAYSANPTQVLDSSGYYKSYENIGVIVTDLTIQGSSKTDLYALGCVSPLASQSVSFAASTTTALSGYGLWFKSPSTPCGGVPADAVVAPVATINGATATWSASFNFSSFTASKSVYRLCAAKGNTVLDFAPLGVRVVSITLNANTNPVSTAKAASVKPLANQTVQITADAQNIASGDKVFFITEMAGVTCHCVNSGNCVGQLPAQTNKLSFTANGPYEFDFSTFSAVTAAKATMCVTDSAGALVYSYACQSVSFDATISPAIVPANYGQIVQVTYTGNSVAVGDQVMFTTTASCPTNDTFATAKTSSYKYNTDAVTVATSGTALTFNFTGMWIYKDVTAKMCVLSGNDVFMLSGATITVGPSVVGIAGDPHVRSANGEWLDFYGATGVYNVYSGPQMVANAKFGFAVRDNHMIWHPKVMRPGTMVEEVGIKLLEAGISLRLGVYGGGLLSIRESLKPTEFLTAKNSKEVQVGNYNIAWEPCTKDCTVVMPWGTHERSHSLTVQGEGEFMQLFVAHSGGYRFIDIEAQPAASSTGLLADALMAPLALADRLRSGGEKNYVLQSAALLSA